MVSLWRITIEPQESPAMASRSSEINADEIAFGPGGFTVPGYFEGDVG
jgi:hypothetical protein